MSSLVSRVVQSSKMYLVHGLTISAELRSTGVTFVEAKPIYKIT